MRSTRTCWRRSTGKCVEEKVWRTNVVLLLYYVCFSNIILAVGDTEHENLWKDFFYKVNLWKDFLLHL